MPIGLAACLTLVWVVGIVQRYVAIVGVACLKGFVTYGAHKWSIISVQLHVVLKRVTSAQLLAADLQMIEKEISL